MDKHECYHCGTLVMERTGIELELYDTPWDEIPEKIWVHTNENITEAVMKRDGFSSYGQSCLEYLFDQGWADFRYFDCAECGRAICRQNPSNGWMGQVREMDGGEIELCLRCYQEIILRDGMEREGFEDGRIAGMFFSGDNHEPLEAGYQYVDGFRDVFVRDSKEVCSKVLELMNCGYLVVVGYEHMAIGGLEGYVTIFSKEVDA